MTTDTGLARTTDSPTPQPLESPCNGRHRGPLPAQKVQHYLGCAASSASTPRRSPLRTPSSRAREVLYVTRGATGPPRGHARPQPRDHRRPAGDGPRRYQAGLRRLPRDPPGGRYETATVTVLPPTRSTCLMKRPKAPRDAAILGLGLHETETETIPAPTWWSPPAAPGAPARRHLHGARPIAEAAGSCEAVVTAYLCRHKDALRVGVA